MQNKFEKIVKDAIDDLKGQDVLVIDISDKSSVADVMIIATGRSDRHVRSIAENVVLESKKAGNQPLGSEGLQTSNWVLVDLGDILVHVMTAEAREFYSLEKLWTATYQTDTDEA